MLLPAIHGRTVMLRNFSPEEVTTDYVNWLNDPRINKYLEVRHAKITLETQKVFIDQINKSTDTYIFGMYVEGNRMVGTTKLGPVDSNLRTGDIGILIGDSNYWQKGLATEVIQILCDAFKSAHLLQKVTAGAAESNIGSIKAFEKNGFSREEMQLGPGIDEYGNPVRNVILTKIL